MGQILNRRRVMGSNNTNVLSEFIDGTLSGTFTIPDVEIIRNYCFAELKNLTTVIIPNGVTSIGGSAFYQCTGLTSITIPDSVTSIGSSAFGYTGLLSIEIPRTITRIPAYCFRGTKISSLVIPDTVTIIESENAVSDCPNLETVVIGSGIVSIGNYTFIRDSKLKSVTIRATVPPTISNTTFSYNHADRKFYVPSGSVDAYKSANVWSQYANVIFAIEE